MNRYYFLVKTTDLIYKIPSVKIFFGIHGWSAISIDEVDYQLVPKFDIQYYQITKNDIMGFKNFGAGKSVVTISVFDNEEDIDFDDYEQKRNKVKIPVTQERYNAIVNSMKLFAKVLLEEEFDKRFNKLRHNGSFLEVQTWKDQINEVEKYKKGESTPLLNSIASLKAISVEDLVNLIQSKIDKYTQDVQDLYLKLLELKTEFNNCVKIEELNILYAKYFGQTFYISDEYKQTRPDVFDENGEYKFKIPVTYNF